MTQAAGRSEAGGRSGQLRSSGLRPGWTTGACAAAAARAAYVGLRTGAFPDPVRVVLPGSEPAFALTSYELLTTSDGESAAEVAVTKDAGDDPDITHGAVIRVRVSLGAAGAGLTFEAGPGVGVVTLPGLPLPVGEPAINPMPRAMIADNLAAAARALGAPEGTRVDAHVVVSVDGGAELATRTLNPRLGIVGGLSILGTTGVVVPYSCAAWIDAIRRGVDVARAAGLTHLVACTGSTSEGVARSRYGVDDLALLDMGDFVGAVLTYVRRHPVPRLSIVGGVAKLSKLAAGHLDLHSARSSVDVAFLASLAAAGGVDGVDVERVRDATTALGAVADVPALGDLIAAAARVEALRVLRGATVEVDVVAIDRAGNVLGSAGTA